MSDPKPRTAAGQTLRGLLRKVPTHSGVEYRNWMALLVKAEQQAEAIDPEQLARAMGSECVLHFEEATWKDDGQNKPPCAGGIAAEYARLLAEPRP